MDRNRIHLTGGGPEHYRRDREEIDAAVGAVLERGSFVMGPEVPAFEAEFARYCGVSHSVAVKSGTSALLLALVAAGVQPGDEVIGVANADLAISLAAIHRNADLKWADIEPETFNMDPESLAQSLTPRTKAVIVAHMYGLMADMDAIGEVLEEYPDVVLIEDASLATGAEYRGRRAGSFGDMACFSLASTKMLGVIGSGGVITTDSFDYYQRLNWARHYGRTQSPYNYDDPLPPSDAGPGMVIEGLNERMDTIQAAVALVKLPRMPEYLLRRREIAAHYDATLGDSPCVLPTVPADRTHCYRVYPILVADGCRDRVVANLREEGIDAGPMYVPPDHLHPYFRERGAREGMLPVTEEVARRIVCLPSHPYMTDEDVRRVADACAAALDETTRGR